MRKNILVFVTLYILVSIILLRSFHSYFAMSIALPGDTYLDLPTAVGYEESKQIFEFAGSEDFIYKIEVKEKSTEIYTNDQEYYQDFNRYTTNGKKVFGTKYSVYLGAPQTMSGTFKISDNSGNYASLLEENIVGLQEVPYTSSAPKLYGMNLVLFGLLILIIYLTLYYQSEFEMNKREILLVELHGNQKLIKRVLLQMLICIEIVTIVIMAIVFRVDTKIELTFMLISLLFNTIIMIIVSLYIFLMYRRIVQINFKREVTTRSSKSIYLYVVYIVMLLVVMSYLLVDISSEGQTYINNQIIAMQKPKEYYDMYKASYGYTSEIGLYNPPNMSGEDGLYLKVSESTPNMVKINCKYATEVLGMEQCVLGDYVHGKATADGENTYQDDIEIIPYDLASPPLENPWIQIVDDSNVITSSMYWKKKVDIPYLNINTNKFLFKQDQRRIAKKVIQKSLILLIVVINLYYVCKLFMVYYMYYYGKEISLGIIHGVSKKVTFQYIVFSLLLMFGIYQVLENLGLGAMHIQLLGLILFWLLWLILNYSLKKITIKNCKSLLGA